jgi:hypothetical protein
VTPVLTSEITRWCLPTSVPVAIAAARDTTTATSTGTISRPGIYAYGVGRMYICGVGSAGGIDGSGGGHGIVGEAWYVITLTLLACWLWSP